MIPSSNVRTFIESLRCNVTTKKCMYGECSNCKTKNVPLIDNTDMSYYFQWITHKESRLGKKDKVFEVTITSKKKINCSVSDMIKELNSRLPEFLRHCYDTSHQHKALQSIQLNLKANEVKSIIDFSQNYVGKYASEIQSVHFGASKTQFSLHTGVFYYKVPGENKTRCVSFSTVSECLRHDACAVWAHLKPILALIKTTVPEVKTLHF